MSNKIEAEYQLNYEIGVMMFRAFTTETEDETDYDVDGNFIGIKDSLNNHFIFKKDEVKCGFENEYENIEKTIDGYAIKLKKSDIDVKEDEYVCISKDIPPYLEDKKLEISAYFDSIEKETKISKLPESFKVKEIKHGFMYVETNKSIDFTDKKIFLSIYSDQIQWKRIFDARSRLLSGQISNHNLIDLMSDKEIKYEGIEKADSVISPISDFVREKIFKNEPTQNQIEAIKLALNTPDVAIIQGPPGTGKTTVITAILERLNEISDKTNNGYGSSAKASAGGSGRTGRLCTSDTPDHSPQLDHRTDLSDQKRERADTGTGSDT